MQAGRATSADPNLTPLLDLVLQLVMFFMLVTNFVMEQVNDSIHLPMAQMARPMEKSDLHFLFLNMNEKGELLVLNRTKALIGPEEIGGYLRLEFEDAQRRAGQGEVKTKVVIRADEKVAYSHVYTLMQMCRAAGFRNLELRAKINTAGQS